MNIILFKGEAMYGVTRFFTDEMAAAFIKLGHNAIVIDLMEKGWGDKFNQSLTNNNGCDFFFAFNGIGIDLAQGNDGRSFYDVMDVPFVAALVDHPCHNIPRLDTKMNHLIVTCVDKAHLDFLSFYYPEGHIKVKSFLPHGGSAAGSFTQERLDAYLEKRTIPLLFTGGFKKAEKTWYNWGSAIASILDDMVDCILGNETISLDGAYNYVLKQRGIELDHEQSRKMHWLFSNVDEYVRGYMRQACLEVIAKAGIPVILYGHNWDNWLNHKKYKSITYLGVRDYQYLFDDLQKTKLFLNNAHNYILGAHERDFNAMLNGAVSVTQFNLYYNEEFIDGKEIVLYKIKELDSLPDKIFRLLDNPEITWQIAKAAKEKAEARHTWLNRAEKVLDIVKIYSNLH